MNGDAVSNTETALESRTIEFLDALQSMDQDAVRLLVGPDIIWRNSGLPAVRGKKRVEGILKATAKVLTQYQVTEMTELHTRGETVFSRRSEVLRAGWFAFNLAVEGRFTFRDGLLVVWDDRFSYGDLVRGIRICKPE